MYVFFSHHSYCMKELKNCLTYTTPLNSDGERK
jgi:hypothetical protein